MCVKKRNGTDQGVQQPGKPGKPRILREFDLPQGKPGKPGNLREFCVGNWVDTLLIQYPICLTVV